MKVSKYLYTAIIAILLVLSLAVAVSARFNLSNITSDPYEFIVNFLELWAPALSAVGTIVVAILIVLILYHVRRSQEQEKEQHIRALHDEIDINLSTIVPLRYRIDKTLEPYSTEIRLGLSMEDRRALFEHIDTAVFEDIKNSGNLHWLDFMRMEIISCYRLIRTYNLDGSFEESHPKLLNEIQKHLERSQKNLEDHFHFLPHYTKRKKKKAESEIEGESPTAVSS